MDSTYTTTRGVTVTLVPIGTKIQKQHASFLLRRPKPPTYIVTTATGVSETHEHDAVSVLDAKTTDAERAAWANYQAALTAHDAAYSEAFLRLLLTRGVEVPGANIGLWVEEQRWLGIDVPDEERERLFQYVWMEIIGDALRDIEGISLAVGKLSGVSEEAIQAAEATFQHGMGDAGEPPAA